MFQAPPQDDDTLDWTDTLTQKVIPAGGAIAGGIIGGILGGKAGGASGAATGAGIGAQSGYGSGQAIGGLLSKKKGSSSQFDMGTALAIQGWRPAVDLYNQQKKTTDAQVNQAGVDPARPGAASPAPTGTQYTMPAQAAPVGVPDDNRKWKWGPPD